MEKLTNPEIISGLSMLVALCAVIIGPAVTFIIASRQIISPIRQKWIDELRELMSQFLSESRKIIVFSDGGGLLNADTSDEFAFQKLLYLEQKLGLMLNPNEARHSDLVILVHSITDDVHHGVANIIEFGKNLDDATKLCQRILKLEWERVKSGDI